MNRLSMTILCMLLTLFIASCSSGTTTQQRVGGVGDLIKTTNSGNFTIVSITATQIGIEKQKGHGPWMIPASPGEHSMGNKETLIVVSVDHVKHEFTYKIHDRDAAHPLDF